MKGIVVGINLGATKFGKELHDGGAAVIRDGLLLGAVAEERISRKKYAGGAKAATASLLDHFGITYDQVDLVVVSTCCEEEQVGSVARDFPRSKIVTCNHHLSHAFASFVPSGFDEAIIMVMDGGGNTFSECQNEMWWNVSREQHTYFIGRTNGITALGRDFFDPNEAGIGEVYRAFTYFLGWPGSRQAGRVMSLAAYGNPGVFPAGKLLWLDPDGNMRSSLKCEPSLAAETVEKALEGLVGFSISKRNQDDPISQVHCDVAAWVQNEVENVIRNKAISLMDRTGIRNLCLAGGVAYNCRAMGALSRSLSNGSVFVGPAAGDHGQCLGNAFYGATLQGWASGKMRLSPYLGSEPKIDTRYIVNRAAGVNPRLVVTHTDQCVRLVARKLLAGAIGAVFQGRSEFGPRALGNRSILANPNDAGVRAIVNLLKGREAFMPFAPVVTAESASRYFETTAGLSYMTMAVRVTELFKLSAPATVHLDGTARVQTVSPEECYHLYKLLVYVGQLTGHPILLNTSFNPGGEPIVETAVDALQAFDKMGLDFLWIGNLLVEKRSLGVLGECLKHIPVVFLINQRYLQVRTEDIPLLLGQSDVTLPIEQRNLFMLFREYVELFRKGRKTTTIRFRKESIDLPTSCVLPLYASESFDRDANCTYVDAVSILSIKIIPFGFLTNEDACRDGFNNKGELVDALTSIYGPIGNKEFVTVYEICALCP